MGTFLKKMFYHAFDPADKIFCHNIKNGNGRISSISFARAKESNLKGLRSPYEVAVRADPKENLFEQVRKDYFQDQPSRLGAIFLFDNLDLAKEVNMSWWHGKKVILPTKIVKARCIGRYDSKHLDIPPQKWEDAARKYWSGIFNQESVPEVLVNGIIQLYRWEPYAESFNKREWTSPLLRHCSG